MRDDGFFHDIVDNPKTFVEKTFDKYSVTQSTEALREADWTVRMRKK